MRAKRRKGGAGGAYKGARELHRAREPLAVVGADAGGGVVVSEGRWAKTKTRAAATTQSGLSNLDRAAHTKGYALEAGATWLDLSRSLQNERHRRAGAVSGFGRDRWGSGSNPINSEPILDLDF